MKRRIWFALSLLYYFVFLNPNFVVADKLPNIILIVADDLGYNDIGFHGSDILTPNLDRLAKSGVILENYYVQPSCGPSRSQLLTGRYGIHTGFSHGNIDPLEPTCLSLDEVTIADKLKERGYKTHMVGKWHLGFYRRQCTPTYRGFDSFYGLHLGSGDHYRHGKIQRKPYFAVGFDLWRNESISMFEGSRGYYSTTLFRNMALNIVSNHDQKHPLFMYLSFQAPHSPLQVPEEWLKPYLGVKDNKRRLLSGMVSAIDAAVGDLVENLKKHDLWKNTVLVFTTDNGGQIINGGNNWPLRGGKGSYWEGGIRGVGFVNSPLLHRPGRSSRRLMHISDWFPTFVRLSRGNLNGSKPLDGVDQWDSISRNKKSKRKEILLDLNTEFPIRYFKGWKHHVTCRKQLRMEDYICRKKKIFKDFAYKKKCNRKKKHCFKYDKDLCIYRGAIRKGKWKLLVGSQKPGNWIPVSNSGNKLICSSQKEIKKDLHLFNVKNDPEEKIDLSMKYPGRVTKLLARLKEYQRSKVPAVHAKHDVRGIPQYNNHYWGPWVHSDVIL